jgi:hypothetical protein
MDLSGNIFVSDYSNNVIRIIFANGTVSTYAGNTDAIIPIGDISFPIGLSQDSDGNITVGTIGQILKIKNIFYSTAKATSTASKHVKTTARTTIVASLGDVNPNRLSVTSTIKSTLTSTSVKFTPKRSSVPLSLSLSLEMPSNPIKFTTRVSFTSKMTSTPIKFTSQRSSVTSVFATQTPSTPEPIVGIIKYANIFPESLIFFSVVPKKNQPIGIEIMGATGIEIYYLFILVSAYYMKWRTPFYKSSLLAFTFLIMNTSGYIFFMVYNIDRTIKISDSFAAALTLSVTIFTGLTQLSIISMLCTRIREITKVTNSNQESSENC